MGPSANVGIWCVRLDEAATAAPVAVLQGVPGTSGFSIARDGTIAYATSWVESDLWSLPLSPAGQPASDAAPLLRDTSRNSYPRFSPDGRFLAFSTWRPGSPWDLWLMNMKTLATEVVVTGKDAEFFPSWMPDNRHVLMTTGGGFNASRSAGRDRHPSGRGRAGASRADGQPRLVARWPRSRVSRHERHRRPDGVAGLRVRRPAGAIVAARAIGRLSRVVARRSQDRARSRRRREHPDLDTQSGRHGIASDHDVSRAALAAFVGARQRPDRVCRRARWRVERLDGLDVVWRLRHSSHVSRPRTATSDIPRGLR